MHSLEPSVMKPGHMCYRKFLKKHVCWNCDDNCSKHFVPSSLLLECWNDSEGQLSFGSSKHIKIVCHSRDVDLLRETTKLNCLWKILWQRFERTLFFQWFFGLKSSISLLVTQKVSEFTKKVWSWSHSWPTTEKNNFPCLLLFWRARMRAVVLLCWHL